jgi:fatty-acyl-CoA synthase
MPSWALTIDRILEHAASAHPQVEVFTAASTGAPSRTTWSEFGERVRRLAGALAAGGLRRGDVVAMIGSSSARQLEGWYAVMGLGAICHPLNPGLPIATLARMLSERRHKVVFIEPPLLAKLEPVLAELRLDRVVALAESDEPVQTGLDNLVIHDVLASQGAPAAWQNQDEAAPALLIHTAGPSEQSRVVTWPHRACVLEAMTALGSDGLDLSDAETILPLTPLWRAAAWGLAFAAPMAGAKLVLPGRRTDAQAIRVLADREGAGLVVGAPVELQALHDQFRTESRRPTGLKRVLAVGAPCPNTLVKAWRDNFGIEVRSAWGLSETSSIGTVFNPGSAGRSPPFGLELEIVDHGGAVLPRDGASVGRLRARGPMIAGDAAGAEADFVDTGDLASIDPQGRVRILGRADSMVFAAGGLTPAEPIEAAALEHPATAQAAAIDALTGLAEEGPVLVVARRPGVITGKAELLRYLGDRLGPVTPKDVLWVDGIPLDPAGRVDRPALRARLERLGRQAQAPEPSILDTVGRMLDPAVEQPAPEPVPETEPALAEAAAAGPVVYLPERPAHDPAEPISESPTPPDAEPPSPLDLLDEPEAGPITAEVVTAPEPPAPVEAAAPEQPAPDLPPPGPPEPEPQVIAASTGLPLLPAPLGPLSLDEPDVDQPRQLRVPGPPPIEPSYEDFEAPVRRSRADRPAWAKWFLSFTAVLAAAPLVMLLAVAVGLRFGLIDWRTGLSDQTLDWPYRFALVGLVGGLLAIFAALFAGFGQFWRRALFSLAGPLAVIGLLIWLSLVQQSYPPLHDVATDWAEPLRFSPVMMKLRGPGANPVEDDPVISTVDGHFTRRVAELNGDTCPEAHPVLVSGTAAEAFSVVRNAVSSAGLTVVTSDAASGRIEAYGTNPVLGLTSDLAVRIRSKDGDSRIDLRSSNRESPQDFGVDCALVSRVVLKIQGGG